MRVKVPELYPLAELFRVGKSERFVFWENLAYCRPTSSPMLNRLAKKCWTPKVGLSIQACEAAF